MTLSFVNCRPVYLKDFLIQKVTSNYNCQKSKQNVKNKISALSNSQYSKLMGENQLETDQDIFQSLVDQTVLNQLYKKYHVSVSVNDAKKMVSQQDLQIQKSLKSSNKDERESAKGTYDQIQDFIKAYKMNGNDYKNARVESAKRILMFDQLYDKYSKQFATESDFEKQQNFQVFIRLKEKHACVIKLF